MTEEQKSWIIQNVLNGEALLNGDPNDLLLAMDDMMMQSLGKDYEPTPRTSEISRMYDAIYSNLD